MMTGACHQHKSPALLTNCGRSHWLHFPLRYHFHESPFFFSLPNSFFFLSFFFTLGPSKPSISDKLLRGKEKNPAASYKILRNKDGDGEFLFNFFILFFSGMQFSAKCLKANFYGGKGETIPAADSLFLLCVPTTSILKHASHWETRRENSIFKTCKSRNKNFISQELRD